MAQPAMLPRRAGSGAALEDFPAALLVQSPPASPAAAPACPAGPPPPPPSLALLPPPPASSAPPPGAQLKKKSGFQITSVTPAQISASLSSNNSIAEDTESYDDLDESHTEDFSSSEILDASLSRATDLGEPERSSSEETLNNFHEADSPGAVSPNQPRPGPPQPQPQQQPPRGLANGGGAHPPHGPHYAHGHSGAAPPAVSGGSPSSPSFRRLPVAGSLESARPGPAVGSLPGPTAAPFHHTGAGTPRQVSKTLRNLAATGNGMALAGGSHPGNVGLSGGVGNGTGPSSNAAGSAGPTAAGAPAAGHLQPAGSTSRFRVVKLDSSLEPFKKGRWTCTEFYDKENSGPAAESAAVAKTVEALLDAASERESTSGSSVSSTLSHYTESVGSGEMGAPSGAQQPGFPGGPQQMDFSSAGSTPGLPQSMSQSQLSQLQPHPQEVSYPPQKQGVPPPASAVPPPLTVLGGHQPTLASQQLPFAPSPAQPVAVAPQSLPFGQGQAQHPTALPPMSMQMAPGHVKPVTQTPVPEYIQPPQMLPALASSLQPGTAMVGGGSAVPIAQPHNMQLPVQGTHIPGVPPQPVAQAQPTVPAVGAAAPLINVGPPGSVAPVAQRPPIANQMAPSVMAPGASVPAPSQAAAPVPGGVVHPGSQAAPAGLPQSLGIPPPSNLIPMKAADPLLPGMAQLPPVSPVPPASAAPVPGPSAASVPLAPVPLAPSKTLTQQNGTLVPNVSQPALISTSTNLPGAANPSQFSAQSFAQSVASRTEEAKRPAESTLVGLTQPCESSLGPTSALADGSMVSLFPLKVLPLASLDGEEDSSSGASVVAIDNKIEQAMDLVKSHLMYAVREEVEVLKEQIKELIEKNNQLEQENSLLKTLASPEQLAQFQAQLPASPSPAPSQTQGTALQPSQAAPPSSGPSA